jgi:hypothetical protein
MQYTQGQFAAMKQLPRSHNYLMLQTIYASEIAKGFE